MPNKAKRRCQRKGMVLVLAVLGMVLLMITGGGLKLALGILFVSFGFKVMGALSGFAIATLVVLVFTLFFPFIIFVRQESYRS